MSRPEPATGSDPGEWLRSGNESPETSVSAGTKPSLTAAKGGAEIVAERQREPGGSRCPHFVSIFWIIVKTGGLGPPITVVRQRLIRRVGFPEKRVENPVRSEW